MSKFADFDCIDAFAYLEARIEEGDDFSIEDVPAEHRAIFQLAAEDLADAYGRDAGVVGPLIEFGFDVPS